mmetsp:Transcript_60849/g.133311  ORF Transcript_60849/g.133311 Transcript_60849/m.133311 type:complete len:84 (-) Transcript_60849:67-318(-)
MSLVKPLQTVHLWHSGLNLTPTMISLLRPEADEALQAVLEGRPSRRGARLMLGKGQVLGICNQFWLLADDFQAGPAMCMLKQE